MRRFAFVALVCACGSADAQSLGKLPGEKIGSWEIETLTDSFTDVVRGITHTPLNKDGTIVIKCDQPGTGRLYISIFTATYLGSDDIGGSSNYHSAQYRLDDGPPQTLASPYYSGKSASLLGGSAPTKFLNILAGANPKRFRAQFLSFDSNLATVDIDVTGIAAAIRKTAAICKDSSIDS